MVLQSLFARGKSVILHQQPLHKLSPRYQHFLQWLVPNVRIQDFCTAGVDDHETAGHKEDEKPGDEKQIRFRNKIKKLRKLKQEMEELEKKYDSYFTPEYASKLTENEFKDSDDDFVDSSESERSGLEISEDELSLDDSDNGEVEDDKEDEEEDDVDAKDSEEEDDEDDEDDEDEDDFDDIDEDNDYDEK